MEATNPTNQPQFPPNNHLALAIITTILCCLPAGIVSIVYATQVNSKWQAGDYEGAQRASKNAKTWWIVAAVAGLVVVILSFAIYGVAIFSMLESGEFEQFENLPQN
ncbi:MAG: CD225/dispanin family protein [Psychroflexus sp.]|jgi:hypothetical protein|nr:CD225/dispanin family protein [Psychroflexus sp.]MDR9448894.1 CD225/dispanin family protein [Psychroflexus sp.]